MKKCEFEGCIKDPEHTFHLGPLEFFYCPEHMKKVIGAYKSTKGVFPRCLRA